MRVEVEDGRETIGVVRVQSCRRETGMIHPLPPAIRSGHHLHPPRFPSSHGRHVLVSHNGVSEIAHEAPSLRHPLLAHSASGPSYLPVLSYFILYLLLPTYLPFPDILAGRRRIRENHSSGDTATSLAHPPQNSQTRL